MEVSGGPMSGNAGHTGNFFTHGKLNTGLAEF